MTKPSLRWPKIGCYALLILFAAYLAYAGARWVDGTIARVFPSSVSPDGTQFISLQYDDNSGSTRYARIRDAETGAVIADLSDFQWSRNLNLSWSPDGTHVAGFVRNDDGTDKIVSVQVRPVVRLDAEYPYDGARRVEFDAQNRVMTKRFRVLNGRPQLEFCTEDTVTAMVDIGKQEGVQIEQTLGDIVQVRVLAQPSGTDAAGNPMGEFLHTDGTQDAYLWINQYDGSVVHKLEGRFHQVPGTKRYVMRYVAKSGVEILDRDDLSRPVVELPPNEGPIFLVGHQLVSLHNYPYREAVYVYDLGTGKKQRIAVPNPIRYINGPDQRPIFADGKRKFGRLNLGDGEITPLIDLTVSPVWKWSVMLGLPLLWALWIIAGVCFGSRYPFLDMIALSGLTVLVSMGWSMLCLREYRPDLANTSVTMVSVAAAALFCLIWASSTKTFWGTLLPACVGSVAVIILLIRIWSYNSSYRIVEGLVGCVVGLGAQVFGLWLVRRFAGRISRQVDGESQVSAREAQMTLRQGLTLTVAFCVLFASVRDVNVSEFIHPGTKMFVLWMTFFTTKMVVAGVAAIYSGLRWKNTFVSCLVAISVSALYSVLTYALSSNWKLQLLISPVQRCILPVAVAALVWVGIRYCRYHGYRFERPSDINGETDGQIKARVA